MKIIRFINVISEKLLATVVITMITILFSDSLLFPRHSCLQWFTSRRIKRFFYNLGLCFPFLHLY